jgi:hypothetical protein
MAASEGTIRLLPANCGPLTARTRVLKAAVKWAASEFNAELSARAAAGLDDRHANPERCYLLGDRLDEAFDSPLRGVVRCVNGNRSCCHETNA